MQTSLSIYWTHKNPIQSKTLENDQFGISKSNKTALLSKPTICIAKNVACTDVKTAFVILIMDVIEDNTGGLCSVALTRR